MRNKNTSNNRHGVGFWAVFVLWRGTQTKKEGCQNGRQCLLFLLSLN